MKIDYITLCIFILIIILCCVTMLYQYQQKIQKVDILENEISNPQLLNLITETQLKNRNYKNEILEPKQKPKNNKHIVENFESNDLISQDRYKIWVEKFKKKLLIRHIKIEGEGIDRKIVVIGQNLNKIKQVFFGEIEGMKFDGIETIKYVGENHQQIKIVPPNFNDSRFKSLENIDSLELKFLIKDGDSEKKTSPQKVELNKYNFIDIQSLGLKNSEFQDGFTKQVKISFDLKYFIPTAQYSDGQTPYNKIEISPHYYTDKELASYDDPPDPFGDQFKEQNIANRPIALQKYKYMSPEKVKCVKSFQGMCTEIKDPVKATERQEVKTLCENKNFYDHPAPSLDEGCEQFIYQQPSPSPSPEYSQVPYFADKPPIRLKFNQKLFDKLKEGRNTILLTINKDNYVRGAPKDTFNKKIAVDLPNEEKKYFEIKDDSTEKEDPVTLYNVEVSMINEEKSVIIPSGLYYKPGVKRVSSDKKGIKYDPASWSLELGKKMSGESDSESSDSGKLVNSITGFYTSTQELLQEEEEEVIPEKTVEDILRDSWSKKPLVNDKTRELEFTWETPSQFTDEPNLDKYKYYFIFELVESVEEQNSNVVTDDLKEKIIELPVLKQQDPTKPFTGDKMFNTKITFSYERLKPLAKYKYSFWLITNTLGGNNKIIESEYEFVTPEMKNSYHSHLFDPVTKKFKLEMISRGDIKKMEPELLQTYYQMLAYNKRKNEDDVLNAQIDMQDSNQCMKANINQFQNRRMGSTFNRELTKFITGDKLKEGEEFDIYQEKQEKQILNIQKKLAEVEKHHDKKVSLQDLQIKTLKSLQDGSLIRLEELAGEKKLVMLNEGCLAYNKKLQFGAMDDYGYIPCNRFDTEQHFTINKINNLDEYNFLLSSNLSPRVEKEDDNNLYPFYTLQPSHSDKCVSIQDAKLKIIPCNDSKSIKFQGFFSQDECNV